jgi:hypothetical protein
VALPPQEALALGALAYWDLEQATRAAEHALTLLATAADGTRQARMERVCASALRLGGHHQAAKKMAECALESATAGTSREELALCHHCLGTVLRDSGERARARSHLCSADTLLSTVQSGGWSQEAQQAHAEVYMLLGQLDEARRLLGTVAQWGERRRVPLEAVRAQAVLCLVELESGEAQAAEQAGLAAARACRQQTAVPSLDALIIAGRALAAARQGRWGPCQDLVDRLRNRDLQPWDHDTVRLFERLAVEAFRLGQTETGSWLQGRVTRASARWRAEAT